jgi:glycosyltransferase involved in cell wall biosynthesis
VVRPPGSGPPKAAPRHRSRPDFLNREAWFVFLLRGDVRGGARPDDPDAQREFAAWWLLHGRDEFPWSWHWDRALAAAAMEPRDPAPAASGEAAMPRLLRRLRDSRNDLAAAFPPGDPAAAAELACWYRLSGPAELPAAPALPHAAMLDTERHSDRAPWSLGPPVPRMAAALWARNEWLQTRFDAHSPAGRAGLAAWYVSQGRRTVPLPTPAPVPPPEGHTARGGRRLDPGGINLVGFARAEFGLGEDVRMMAASLKAVGVPYTVIDVPPAGSLARRNDRSLDTMLSEKLVFDATVFCMTAFDTAQLHISGQSGLFAAARNVGYWPWELPNMPADWEEAYDLVDEVWAASRFARDAHAAAWRGPVRLMPPAVSLPAVRCGTRAGFGLPPADVFLFGVPFDPNSFLARKNPLAAVRAFRLAFPDLADRGVGLLLRVNGVLLPNGEGDMLRRAVAEDPRVLVLDGTRERDAALGILSLCDAMVSLHRSEGFGRNIAEAILLGLPVLATGYSGCVDFLRPEESIRWTPRPVKPGEYPFGDGQSWAEPCIEHAAEAMRALRDAGKSAKSPAAHRRAEALHRRHGPAAVGQRYSRWLKRLRPSGGIEADADARKI